MLHDRAQGCTTVARGPYLIILALCSPHPPVRKKFERPQNGARRGVQGGGPGGRPRARLIAHIHPRSDPCIPLHTLTDPYRPLHILAYPCILLQTLTDPYRSLQTLHIPAYPYIPLQASGLGPGPGPWGVARGGGGARTILGPFESFRGGVASKVPI